MVHLDFLEISTGFAVPFILHLRWNGHDFCTFKFVTTSGTEFLCGFSST